MKKYASTFVAFVGLLFVANIFLKNIANPPTAFDEGALREQILALKTQFPKEVDVYTTAIDASYENKILRYEFIVDGIKNSEIEKLNNTNLVSKLFGVCMNKVLSMALKTGTKIEYSYTLAGTENNYTLTLTQQDCAPFTEENSVSLADYYVELQSKTVPVILDEDTAVVAYRKVGNSVHIDYQLYRLLAEDLNLDVLNDNIKTIVLPGMCASPDYSALSQKNHEIQINYYDMQSRKIADAKVNNITCE